MRYRISLLLLFIAILALRPLLASLGRWLTIEPEPLVPADLIHSLGGSMERLDYGVSLYRQGYGRRLFITGSDDALLYRRYVEAQGVPPAAISPARSWATSTYEETQV